MKKRLFLLTAVILMTGLFASCSADNEVRVGFYVTQDDTAFIEIMEDNKFAIMRRIAMSYVPTGEYEIKRGKLILPYHNTENIFKIKQDELVFIRGEDAEQFFAKGTSFIYIGESLSDYYS